MPSARSSVRLRSLAVVAVTSAAAVVVPLGLASPAVAAAPPPLVGDWKFGSGAAVESTGYWSQFALRGTATVDNGELVVSGTGNGSNAATGWAYASGYTGPTIIDKTLVAYVKVTNLTIRSGSPLSLYKPSGEQFDAIDWAESQPNQWMAGSNFFTRTQNFTPGRADTAGPTVVRQIAISYNSVGTRTITGCLDGTQLGSYSPSNSLSVASSDNPMAIFGARHIQAGAPYGSMNARILESRIYAGAMSCAQIAALPGSATPTISTTPSAGTVAGGTISDTATVGGGASPTGSVRFDLYGPADPSCSGTALASRTGTLGNGSAASGDETVTVAGTYHWRATYSGDGANSSVSTGCGDATVVTAGAVAGLVLSPASPTVAAGGSQTFTAEGFDAYGNSLGDVTADTTFTIDGGGTCTGAECTPSGSAGTYTVTGTDGAASGSTTLTVTAGILARLEVYPTSASVAAGGSQTYTATGFDAYGNSLGDVTADTTFTIDGGGTCTGTECTPSTTAGTYTVTGTDGAATGATPVTVTAATADHLVLTPSAVRVVAGDAQTYSATAVDAYGNSVGDVTADTTFTIDGGGTCTGTECTATTAGRQVVTAADAGVTGTAVQSVAPAALDHLVSSPRTATVTAGDARAFTVTAYDRYGNFRGTVTSSLTFQIGGTGSCTGASCTSTRAGIHNVVARFGGKSVTSALQVVPDALDHVVVTPRNPAVTAGASATFIATGYDRFDNARGPITAGVTFTVAGGSCTGASCTATAAGPHTVTATVGDLTATAQLRVVPGDLDRIVVTPRTATITVGGSKTFTVIGYDGYGNSRGDVTAASTFTATAGVVCTGSTCSGDAPGTSTVTASVDDLTATATLRVLRSTGGGTTAAAW